MSESEGSWFDRVTIPNPRIALWILTLLMPYWFVNSGVYVVFLLAPIWHFSVPVFFYPSNFVLGLLLGSPLLFAALLLELLYRGIGRPGIVKVFIALGAIIVAALGFLMALDMYISYGSVSIVVPIPFASLVQYILFRQFIRVSSEPLEAISIPEVIASESERIADHVEPAIAPSMESTTVVPETTEENVQALRGCTAVGGTFEYKVKIQNNTKFVINRISVSIASYPEDCMELTGESTKKISLIEPGGFRSPLFVFDPTKDCVQGQIQASVTYLDQENELQVVRVEPYLIRSVCDLLEPLESSLDEFEALLFDMSTNSEEFTLDRTPNAAFSGAMGFLPERNFELISTESGIDDGTFRGSVRGLAVGKYTKKKVAVRIVVSGQVSANNATVLVEALGDDPDMLPTTIEEIVEGLKAVQT
ncbi:MAG: hypothetical protein ACW99U_04650 [Candidatus Thorarchaeota archaeon]